MAFPNIQWSTDTNYPAGSDDWSATPTRVEPPLGVQQVGITPGDVFPAQYINWALGNIMDWGTDLTLQELFDMSVVATVADIDTGTDTLSINDINFSGDGIELDSSKLVLTDAPATLSVLVFNDATVPDYVPMYGGTWTPVVASVVGTTIVSGDITDTSGYYQRIGNMIQYVFRFTLDTTGWDTSTRDIRFTPPIGTANGPSIGLARAENLTVDRFVNILLLNSENGITVRVSPGTVVGTARTISVSGMYSVS